MHTIEIITNNVPRLKLYGNELTEKEREEFDYIDDEDFPLSDFVRYRGTIYHLGDLMRVPDGSELEKLGWHGYHQDSAFSAVVFKLIDDDDYIICGLALS